MYPVRVPALAALALATVLVAGCGESTGPGTELSGTWTLTHSGISNGGESCSIAGTTMVINQSGSVFSGTYSGGIVACGGDVIGVLGNGIIVDGRISGSDIEFNLDNNTWHNEGTLSANGMSGTVAVVANVGGEVFQGTGNFEASRH
jgi:hypothetical protein